MDMTVRYCASILLLAALFGHNAAGQSAESGTLTVDADTPVVEVDTRPAGRNFMRLPSLNYTFELVVDCAANLTPKAISLSIADTRKSLASSDIALGKLTSISLTVPKAQIGPIAMDGFCVTSSEQESLKIPAVLSVQASLLCANDTDSQIVYASKPLDVTLLCKEPE